MYVEAYQSHLWNDAARRIALAIAPDARDRSSADDEFGVMEFPRAHLTESLADETGASDASDSPGMQGDAAPDANAVESDGGGTWAACVMPVLAKGSELAPPWGPFADDALRAEGITLDQLTIPGLRRPFFGEADRSLFVEATGFALGAWEADEDAPENSSKGLKRHVAFDLPRGAYATVVLRAIGQ
jgi:tRNA(Glu) U13 pseudouridine synthase TruD